MYSCNDLRSRKPSKIPQNSTLTTPKSRTTTYHKIYSRMIGRARYEVLSGRRGFCAPKNCRSSSTLLVQGGDKCTTPCSNVSCLCSKQTGTRVVLRTCQKRVDLQLPTIAHSLKHLKAQCGIWQGFGNPKRIHRRR